MWTLAYDRGVQFSIGIMNMTESYNIVFKDARSLFVATLVKKTFYNCNDIFNKQIKEAFGALASGKVLISYVVKKYER